MSKLKFHKVAAVAVLVATAAWVATGEFTSVGSAATEEAATPTKPEAKPAPVRTVAVIDPPRISHARAIKVSGYTDANQRASLAARAAGIIAELPVRLGTRVKAGDLIMRLDAEGKQSAIDTAKQLLAQRQAEATAVQKLAQSGSVAKLQLDNALSALAAARSQLEAAEADLARNEVIAPFDGVVDKVAVELGSSIQVGSPVATVLNLNPILAIGEMSERDLANVATGHEADVRLVSGRQVKGTVRYVSHDATAATRTYRVEVAVPNDEGNIPSGMTAEITLRAEPVESTVLPRSVITLSANGDIGVRAVDAENKVVFYPIDIVDDSPEGLVLGGIPAGVKIIVAGQDLITEGDTVKPVEADAETLKKLAGEAAAGGTQ